MKVVFHEQDMIDAVCVFAASRHHREPGEFQVELFFEEGRGFAAEATKHHGSHLYPITEQEIIDGIAIYLRDYHNFDPHRLGIELFFEEGIGFSAEIVQR